MFSAEIVGYYVELLNGLGTYVISHAPNDEVKVLKPVNEKIGLAAACPGDAYLPDTSFGRIDRRRPHYLRDQQGQICEIAILQRQSCYLLPV